MTAHGVSQTWPSPPSEQLHLVGHMLSEHLSQGLMALLPDLLCPGTCLRLSSQDKFLGLCSFRSYLTFPQPQLPSRAQGQLSLHYSLLWLLLRMKQIAGFRMGLTVMPAIDLSGLFSCGMLLCIPALLPPASGSFSSLFPFPDSS